MSEQLTAVTHNGKFHADEVFATAVLRHIYPDLIVRRSRDPEVIESGDFVYDVGGVYDHEARRYDHHQNGALKRQDGLTRSAFGLIWLHYGKEYCEGDEGVWNLIDKRLVRGIDAGDNGESRVVQDPRAPEFDISQVIELLNPIPGKPFTQKQPFPESWAGLRENELALATGVPDALFCHSKRFLAVAQSREGAIRLLELALAA